MKKKLLKSLQDINIHKNEELDQKADQAAIHGEASTVIKDYQKIIGSMKKTILNVALQQGKVFKRFKNSERLGDILKELNVSRSKVNFTLNLLKLQEKYPKLKKSSMTCKESKTEFK